MARRKLDLSCFNARTINIAASLFLASYAMAAQAQTPDAKHTRSHEYTGAHAVVNGSGHCAKIEFRLVSGASKFVFVRDDSLEVIDTMTHYIAVPVTFYTGVDIRKNGNDVQCEGTVFKSIVKTVRNKFFPLTSDDVS